MSDKEMPYTMVEFWVRDGDREYADTCILETTYVDKATDLELVQKNIDDDAYEDDSRENEFWIHGSEALTYVSNQKPMTEATKKILNAYGVY